MKPFKFLFVLSFLFLAQLNVNAQSDETVEQNSNAVNLTINSPAINPTLVSDIELLSSYTRGYKNSLTAFYITTSISLVSTMMGALLVGSSVDSGVNLGVAMIVIGGLSSAGSFVSGICMIDYQNRINKQNLKVHLKANGLKMTF